MVLPSGLIATAPTCSMLTTCSGVIACAQTATGDHEVNAMATTAAWPIATRWFVLLIRIPPRIGAPMSALLY
jgi:hypothetical protein